MMWDYIVIGAGSAGSVVANRLSDKGGGSVLLLEAGGAARDIRYRIPVAARGLWTNPKANWGYISEPEPGLDGRRLPIPRGRVMGGSSSINGAIYNRGSRYDFDAWAALGLPEWSFNEVLPEFRAIENSWRGAGPYHGAGGEISTRPQPASAITPFALDAARSLGHPITDDFMGELDEGWGLPDLNVDRFGRRMSSATAFLKPVRNRASLKIQRRATVTAVRVHAGRATDVDYMVDGQKRTATARREIIVSSGAIGSPHILLLSGIGPADELRALGIAPVHDLPGVGRNFNDQATTVIEIVSKQPLTFDRTLRADRLAMAALRWFLGFGGPLAGQPVVALANFRTRQGSGPPDMRIVMASASAESKPWFPWQRREDRYRMRLNMALAHPHSRGAVTLRSNDPMALPRVQYNLLTDARDVVQLRHFFRLGREFLETPAMSPITGRPTVFDRYPETDDEIDRYIRSSAGTTAHPLGSCRMGHDDQAVVDERCRVRGIGGLRVVDASVFPVQISGNPNASVMMLGHRVAGMILSDNG